MQPVFQRISAAISHTMAFYEIDKIRDHMFIFSGKDANSSYKVDWYEWVLKESHKRMEDEIMQTINTCDHNTQVYLFENLKEWLEEDRIKETYSLLIRYEIHKYNQRIYDEFLNQLNEEIEKFQSTDDFKNREHLEEYVIEEPEYRNYGLLSFQRESTGKIKKTPKINYKFYCIEKKLEWINLEYLPDYINMLTKLIDNFRYILTKYVKMYDEGKIKAHNVIYIHAPMQANILPSPKKELPAPGQERKLKVKLTVDQLVYLFRLLHDEALFDVMEQKDIYEFIADNFETPKTTGKRISTTKIESSFCSPELATAKSLVPIIRRLQDAAQKR